MTSRRPHLRILQLGHRYEDIFEANRGILANPDAIEIGQALTIPLGPEAPAIA